ncbi:oxidoreductase [Sphaerisporangium sp. B11E5]|uniref:oxidoreductase n=1 Tax=Sphaerisporangium sp. B11E5 TaxID=3153563 RepID=UPI00325D8A1D
MNDPLAAVAALPGVAEAVQAARAAVDRLYGHRVLRRRGPEVSTESALRGARASASLEGADVPLPDLRAGTTTAPAALGALRASAEVGRLGPAWRTTPRQALARLHALAALDLVDDAALLGRPRTSPAPEAPARGPGDLLDLPPAPSPEAVATRLAMLADLVTATTSATPALVLAAVVHAELLVLRPFGAADGLVARAAERLTLVEFGLDPKSLVAVEVGHAELADTYAKTLRDYLEGGPPGVAAWVRHCAAAVELGAREATAICEALQRG